MRSSVGETARAEREFERLATRRRAGASAGSKVHAGHGLDYETARRISSLPQVVELNIGHFLIGEAVFVGLAAAIRHNARGDGRRARRSGA